MQRPQARRVATRCALVVMLVAAGCERKLPGLEPTPPPAVTVSQPIEREISDENQFTGHTEAIHAVDVHAKVSGFIDQVGFKDGDIVKEGDLLFQIDPRPFDADVARDDAALAAAKARAKRAAADLARAKELIKGKNISQEQFDQVFADEAQGAAAVKQAEASLTTARLNQDYAKVTAAVGGRVSRAIITKGNFVFGGAGSATLLTSIVPIDPIYAYFDVDEAIYLRVARRARDPDSPPPTVEMRLANETGFLHRGRIDFIDNKVDPDTGTIRVRAEFPNADGVITPGLFIKVRVRSPEKRPALLVTDRAVGMDQNRKYVLVVGADNKVEYRDVITGPLVDGLRAVEGGLKPGEWVIVNGLQRARPGAPVEAQQAPMPLPPETEEQPAAEPASVEERDA
ncbi:MAG TPA: efflux RND transporter periplasmic adaptor subunit [Pirellulales bacterium]|jgi:RND family efflux transporter MFP subunit|nr:efflux RND transporter periplasmic adaptor subunit [Pirellulales bacterium]